MRLLRLEEKTRTASATDTHTYWRSRRWMGAAAEWQIARISRTQQLFVEGNRSVP
jgi:hypothetical protein